jgi:thiol-disulfide isomerase/thioredoxin
MASPNQPKMQRVSKTIGLLLTLFGAGAVAVTVKTLPYGELKKLEKKKCALVHLWAAWCGPCVEELPGLLQGLVAMRGVEPVVIDVSPPAMQKKESLRLLEMIAPPFPVFRASGRDLDTYIRAIDPNFEGALPFSVLYHKGKIRKAWTGPVSLAEVRSAANATCR